MSHRGGINRAFSWIKKVLEVTEPTTVPERVLAEVRPSLDVFGWERYEDIETETQTVADATAASAAAVPDGVNRLYLAAEVGTNDIVNQFTFWIEAFPLGGVQVAITPPVTPPVQDATSTIRNGGLPRPFLLGPGGRLRGRVAPATAGGATLTIRTLFIDIPFGEYIPPI